MGSPGHSWAQGRRQEAPTISFGAFRGPKKYPWPRPGGKKTFIAPGPPQGAGQGPGGDRAGTGRGPGGDRAGTGLGSGSATQGFRDPGLATFIFHFEGCRKEGREDEHEDENANKTAQQNMKNTSKKSTKLKNHAPQRAPRGSKMRAWSPPGRFWAP